MKETHHSSIICRAGGGPSELDAIGQEFVWSDPNIYRAGSTAR
jgi:hypothetical protein